MRGYEIKMSSSAHAIEYKSFFSIGQDSRTRSKRSDDYVALITVALGTPLAAGGRAAAGSPANGGKMMVARVAGARMRCAKAPNRQTKPRGIAHNYVTEIFPKIRSIYRARDRAREASVSRVVNRSIERSMCTLGTCRSRFT